MAELMIASRDGAVTIGPQKGLGSIAELRCGARIFSATMALTGLSYLLKAGLMDTQQTLLAQKVLEQSKSQAFLGRLKLQNFQMAVDRYYRYLEEKSSSAGQVWLKGFISKRVTQVMQGWKAHDVLIAHNLGLVVSATPVGNSHYNDLLEYGMLGLVEAAARYDFSRGHRFSTYATRRIEGAIKDGERMLARPVHVSRAVMRQVSNFLASEDLSSDDPKITMAALALKPLSLSSPITEGGGADPVTLAEALPDNDSSIEEQIIVKETQREVREAINSLPPQQRLVIASLSGVGTEQLTYPKLVEMLGVSSSTIYHLRREGLDKLRLILEDKIRGT